MTEIFHRDLETIFENAKALGFKETNKIVEVYHGIYSEVKSIEVCKNLRLFKVSTGISYHIFFQKRFW